MNRQSIPEASILSEEVSLPIRRSIRMFLGNLAQQQTCVIFYSLTAIAFTLIDWHGITTLSFIVTLAIALVVADFASGIWHLYVDFHPLNYEKGYDKLLFYKGQRGEQGFLDLRAEVYGNSSEFDMYVYKFKAHHKFPKPEGPYNATFLDTAYFSFGMLIYAVILISIANIPFFDTIPVFNWPHNYPEIIEFWLFFAIFVGNIEAIHLCVHNPKLFPFMGRTIAYLQKIGFIYSTATHARHHRGEGVGFCFITGHTNFIVNRLCKWLLRRGIITDDRWHGLP